MVSLPGACEELGGALICPHLTEDKSEVNCLNNSAIQWITMTFGTEIHVSCMTNFNYLGNPILSLWPTMCKTIVILLSLSIALYFVELFQYRYRYREMLPIPAKTLVSV